MEIGLREWLILIGAIVILVILFDGWRRMRGGKSKLKLELDRGAAANLPEGADDSSPELLGPARVIKPRPQERDPVLDADDDNLPSISAQARESVRAARHERTEPALTPQDDFDLTLLEEEQSAPRSNRAAGQPSRSEASAPKKELPPIEEVLVINVIAREPQGFRGPALLQNILESGLRFGDMNIFHRHESMTGNGEILFSMANAVKPGTFDLDDIDRFTTPAVSFFLGLPGPRHPKQAFDLMLAATRKLSQELNGELKDDQRSVLTTQTIEHYRQRIVEFERRQMTLKR